MERDSFSTLNTFEKCLLYLFRRRNDNKIPDLNNDIIGFDRGYNCFLLIISYILKCVGHKFGTSKSDIHKIFAYDLRKR